MADMEYSFKSYETTTIGSKKSDDYSQLVEQLKRLMPIGCSDKEKALKELFKYVSSILYGDDLHRFATHEYHSKDAILALDELVSYVQQHSLENLETLREQLKTDIESKEKQIEEIAQLLQERELLESEVEILRNRKEQLSGEEEKIKKSLENYSSIIRREINGEEVVWEEVKPNDTIYGITPKNIGSYVETIKKAYMTRLGISKEECDSDFILNSSGLFELEKLLNTFSIDRRDTPINVLIARSHLLSGNDEKSASTLSKIMPKIKLPRVINKRIAQGSSEGNNMLRELQFQRQALEAISDKRIAEAQLYALVDLFKKVAPEDFDFSQLDSIFKLDLTFDDGTKESCIK